MDRSVDLELVENASVSDYGDAGAWHVGIHGTFCLQDLWDRFGPFIKLLQFGLLFHFSPVFFHFIVSVFFAISISMRNQGWSVVAPILWLIGLLVTCGWGCSRFRTTTLSLAGNVESDSSIPNVSTRPATDGILGVFEATASITNTPSISKDWVTSDGTTQHGAPKRLEE